MTATDLLIVGAGPAGMAAAVEARRFGLDVTVVDEQQDPGGQIWRAVERVAASPRGDILGESYVEGLRFARDFRESGANYEAGAQLWQIEPGFRAFITQGHKARMISAKAVVLATGAQERPVPFPGWTLPGVMTVGAAQILLKSAGEIPDKPVWVAGSGPLPLLYLAQLLRAGGRIAGYLDTTPPGGWRRALPHLPKALGAMGELIKGLKWKAALRQAGVRVVRHVVDLAAEGAERLDAIRFRTAGGHEERVPAELLLVHEGVVPSIHSALAMGCAMDWSDAQDCFVPVLDAWGESSIANLFVVGDGAGIGGAKAADLRGRLAGLRAAEKLGRAGADAISGVAAPLQRRLARELAIRPFLDALFKPRTQVFVPADNTVVCRCEEITAGDIRATITTAQSGPNQMKAFTRVGMGPCQGRQCGYTLTRILAAAQGRSPGEIGFYRIRPPLKPVTLGELASLETEDAS